MCRLVAVLTLVLIGSVAHAAPKTPYYRAMTPYVAELNRQCPGRKLEDLSAGDLDPIMEGFVERLSPAQRRQVQDTVGERCARIEAGLTCANTASLDAFRRLGVLRRFAGKACATTWTCGAFADCTQTRP